MSRVDPITLLVENQASALIRHGVDAASAWAEAEAQVGQILVEMDRIGLADVYVGVALRRAHVYDLRSKGCTVEVVRQRLGISAPQVKRDYSAELARRRLGL